MAKVALPERSGRPVERGRPVNCTYTSGARIAAAGGCDKPSTRRRDARCRAEGGGSGDVGVGTPANEVEQLALLHACLAAAVQPENPVALVAALRSELFGVSDPALYDFKKSGGRFDFNSEIRERISGGMDAGDAERISGAFERLRKYASLIHRMPPVAAAEIVAADLGLFQLAATESGGNLFVGSMAKALELMRAARSDRWSAAGLVEFLAGIIDREDRTDAYDGVPARPDERSAVRVMNLHKAKGLEASVVFLAGPAGDRPREPEMHVDRGGGRIAGYVVIRGEQPRQGPAPTIAMPPDWPRLSRIETQFAEAEEHRLRYVAATRAGAQLVISQRENYKNENFWTFFEKFTGDSEPLPDPGEQKAPTSGKITLDESEYRRRLKKS